MLPLMAELGTVHLRNNLKIPGLCRLFITQTRSSSREREQWRS